MPDRAPVRERVQRTLARYEEARARLARAQREYFRGGPGDYAARRAEYEEAIHEALEAEEAVQADEPRQEPT